MRFSWSTYQLMFLSLETSYIIRTGLPILVKLIDIVNSAITFLSQTTLLRWLTFQLGSQTDSHRPALLDFFLVTLVFVLQWLSPHLEILIMLFSQFPYTSYYIHNRMPRFIELLMTILLLVGTVFVIIWEMFHVRISLDSQKSFFCLHQKDKSFESKVKFRHAINRTKKGSWSCQTCIC